MTNFVLLKKKTKQEPQHLLQSKGCENTPKSVLCMAD